AIIVCSGYDVFDPSLIPEYRYDQIPNVVTAIEFERLLSASGPTDGHLDRPSDRAIEAEVEALVKKAKKSQKMIQKFEDKYSETSADFYAKYQKGEYKGDEDRVKWAEKYAAHLEITEPLEALKKKAEGFSVAKKLAFVQCVGSRDFRFFPFCSGYCCMHRPRRPPQFLEWTSERLGKALRNTKSAAEIIQTSPTCEGVWQRSQKALAATL
ncbi:MAG: hypothetical protein JRJ20_18535, partial [Deltaproteobacteria bacterium]|nr:hypothetical protein [Deltaproteobacteria bacterium]